MAERGKRIYLLDEVRGFAIICMVFFHAFFMMSFMFGWKIGDLLYGFFVPAEPVFAALFIFISGISCHLSRSNAMRGAKLLWISVGLTLVTWVLQEFFGMDDIIIWFGILHLLAFSMLFYAATQPFLEKIPAAVIIPVCAIIFAVTYRLEYGVIGVGGFSFDLPESIAQNTLLFPFGIVADDFYSADYFPIFPWMFMFLAGTAAGRLFKKGKIPKWFYPKHIAPLAFCGRHSLIIYLLHQPVVFAILELVSLIIK